MYRDKTSTIEQKLVSWLLLALCAIVAWIVLTAHTEVNEVAIIYVMAASMLGALSIVRDEFTFPAYMMLTIGVLNLLTSSLNLEVMKLSNVLAPAVAMLAFALLLVGIWKPLRLTKLSFPLQSTMKMPVTRAIAATSLSFFIPLACSIVPIMLNQASRTGTASTLLSWNAYTYALFFTGFSYSLAAVIWIWPPSLVSGKDFFRPQIGLLVATFLASAYFEKLFRNDWTAFVFSQMGVFGTFTTVSYIRSRAGSAALTSPIVGDPTTSSG